MELINTLGIDVGLLITQALNFGLLLIVLTYLLYKPILRVIDDRKERVRKSIEDAKHLEVSVKEMEKTRVARLQEMDREAKEFLEAAKKQAEASKKEIVDRAQREVDQLLEKGKMQLESERKKLLSDLQKTVSDLSVTLASKILEREFSDADQQRLLASIEKEVPALLR
ncbi:MAG: F0F1 ATP synthase subunit B [Candidatus Peregrinibacteria bacterium]|nr:F0F1 ATP synthase subunit B [Candidatus Peregrinibacteria bacterium]